MDAKFPILLPAKHHLTDLIARSIHLRTLHSGPQLLLAIIRQRFWPLRGRDLVRKTVHQCITCFRCQPRDCKQFMAPLPAVRITPAKVFESTGLDYCGPFLVRPLIGRGASVKVWVAVFTCMVVKAVHLDVVASLSSSACVNLLKRFLSRVGRVQNIYCDNSTAFVGANRVVREMRQELQQQLQSAAVQAVMLERGVAFKFITPRAAHFGGLLEAAVKQFKHHFYRIMGHTAYVFDDFRTAVAQIESILNSRPLVPISNHPEDLNALTPGHFLVGEPQFTLPEPDYTTIPTNRLKHFQAMQKSVQDLWKRWSKDYIGLLHNRPSKWRSTPDKINVGSMVILKRDSVPPMHWPLGRVVAVFPGNDNIVRVVNVRTTTGVFQRATTELCVLPIEKEDDEPENNQV